MKKLSIVMLLGLVLGFGFGAVVAPLGGKGNEAQNSEKPALDFPDAVEVEVPVSSPDAGKLASMEKERDDALAEIAELKSALDQAHAEIAARVAEEDKAKQSAQQSRSAGQDWAQRRKERMEQLKKENPDEYAALQKRRQEFQDRLDGAVADKSAFLVNLDTSGMTEEEKKDHDELLGRVAEAWKLMNGMQQGKMPSREDWGSIRENMTAIHDLYGKERDYVLRQVGKDLGYDDQKASEFSTYMQDVFEKTSPNLPMSAWGGHGGGHHSSRGGGQNQGGAPQQGEKK